MERKIDLILVQRQNVIKEEWKVTEEEFYNENTHKKIEWRTSRMQITFAEDCEQPWYITLNNCQ